ncbi:MAG: LysE family transporter [Ignavibacteriales bacterium]|nr:LysE family transporter [Ignavibacteriales bacterium]
MLISLLTGIIAGFLVSMPPLGPVNFAVISKGLKNEHHEGLFIGIGAAIIDTMYSLIAVGGISLIVSFLPHTLIVAYSANEHRVSQIVLLFGALFVFIYGVKLLRIKNHASPQFDAQKIQLRTHKAEIFLTHTTENIQRFTFFSILNMFGKNGGKQLIAGAALAFSSVTLPASWLAIVGGLKSHHLIERTFSGNLLFCVGVFLGTYLCFFVLLKIIEFNKHRIGDTAIRRLHSVSGIFLLLLGITLLLQVLRT